MSDTATAVNSAPSSPASAPTTFEAAFASDATPASESSTQSNDAAAAVQPTTDGASATPATDDRSPFIPRDRFDEVNTKYNELKQWREQYGWAEQVNQEQLQQAIQLAQRYTGDPVAYVQELISEIQSHPEHGAKLRSMAARALAQGRQTQPQADEAMPEPDVTITDGNGQPVGRTYSAEQLAKRDAWLKQQMLSEIRTEFAPVKQSVEQVNAERALLKAQHDAQQFASQTVGEATKYPGMDVPENRKAVAERIKSYGLTSDDPRDLRLALDRAWREVVLPSLSSKAQSQLLDNLQQKAAASTSVNPGAAAPSTASNITRFDDPRLQWK